MNLSELETLLKGICPEFYWYAAPSGVTRYVVAGVSGWQSLYGDDALMLTVPRVWIDIYVQDPADRLLLDIINALNERGLPVSIDGPEYLDDQMTQATTLTLVLV